MNKLEELDRLANLAMCAANVAGWAMMRGDITAFKRAKEMHRKYHHLYRQARGKRNAH